MLGHRRSEQVPETRLFTNLVEMRSRHLHNDDFVEKLLGRQYKEWRADDRNGADRTNNIVREASAAAKRRENEKHNQGDNFPNLDGRRQSDYCARDQPSSRRSCRGLRIVKNN